VIDANYSVRMGYWALKNNMLEYKVYATMIRIFNSHFVNNLQQAFKNNLWLVKLKNCNYNTDLLCQKIFMLGTNKANQYSLVEASCKKWPKTENDLDDNKYELPI
jgi:hypothetical protein